MNREKFLPWYYRIAGHVGWAMTIFVILVTTLGVIAESINTPLVHAIIGVLGFLLILALMFYLCQSGYNGSATLKGAAYILICIILSGLLFAGIQFLFF